MLTPDQIAESKAYLEMGMTEGEFERAAELLGRLPNFTETGLFSVMWSEHCSYKNSKPILRRFPTEGPHVLQGPGEGAGAVDIGGGLAAVFKIESHNHPSAIEPYQGAATGVGGIVRDVFSMGARPIALLNSLRFGELHDARTRYLFEQAVAGIAGYGNCVGIPTIGGEIQFDPCYAKNPLVNVMCIGIVEHGKIMKGVAAGPGNSVMYAGAATGRDGIHGATFASAELSDESEKKRPAVQVGDPFMEKLLIEACLEAARNPAVVGMQDMGAAGLASSSCEMASKGGVGITLDLDKVPQREEGMSAYEMMLSESQERMLLVVEKGREDEIARIFAKHGLHAATVGAVTDCGYMNIYHGGGLAARVPADALAKHAPEYSKPSREPAYFAALKAEPADIVFDGLSVIGGIEYQGSDYGETLLQLLKTPTIASKHWVYSQFDYMVQTNTVVAPGAGCGTVRLRGTNKALAATIDCNNRYVYLDPYEGGKIAVAEAARNLAAGGARPLAVTDNLNFGSPENPEIFWQMERAAEGIAEACRAFGAPVVGGNVSLYNERGDSAIHPTPTIGMVGLVEDARYIVTPSFKNAGDALFLLGRPSPCFGGSELQKLLHGRLFGPVPKIDLEEEKRIMSLLLGAIEDGLARSATDVSKGGLAVAAAKCLAGGFGASFDVDIAGFGQISPGAFLFAEYQSSFLVSATRERAAKFEESTGAVRIGTVAAEKRLTFRIGGETLISLDTREIGAAWRGAIEGLLV